MVIDDFRAQFPEFTDATVYPDDQITFWSTLAESLLDSCRWGSFYVQGVKLYTAHEITIAAQNAKAGLAGGVPGTSGGIASSKTVGSVSVSYDSALNGYKDAGYFNRTTYGQSLYRLMKIFGAGVVQL